MSLVKNICPGVELSTPSSNIANFANWYKTADHQKGSGCSTVGRAVASDLVDPQFESQHRQKFICQLYKIEKTNIKKKRPGQAYFLKGAIFFAEAKTR